MAFKKYAYYNKGNKIALIQQNEGTSSGRTAVAHCTVSGYTTKDTCEAAGGQWIPGSSGSTSTYGKYQSPIESAVNGLEIEYTYAPTYHVVEDIDFQSHTLSSVGWGSDGEYLIFFITWGNGPPDVGSSIADNINFYVPNGRWKGVHKVKSGKNNGVLQTYTKFSHIPCATDTAIGMDWIVSTDETITTSDDPTKANFNEFFGMDNRDQKYIFVTGYSGAGEDPALNSGLFRVSYDVDSFKITAHERYIYNITGSKIGLFTSATPTFVANAEVTTGQIYWAVQENNLFIENVDVMENEDFELDITRTQAEAVVYYIKAKLAEDMLDLKTREYFMRLFKIQIEKFASRRKSGPSIIQSHWNLR